MTGDTTIIAGFVIISNGVGLGADCTPRVRRLLLGIKSAIAAGALALGFLTDSAVLTVAAVAAGWLVLLVVEAVVVDRRASPKIISGAAPIAPSTWGGSDATVAAAHTGDAGPADRVQAGGGA